MPNLTTDRRPAPFVAALLLGLLIAALGATSFERKIEAFQPIGFEAFAHQGTWLVAEVASLQTGVQMGDEILTVDGARVPTLEHLRELLRSRSESRIQLLRGAEMQDVTYVRPPLALDPSYLILVAIGLAYLLIGLYTVLKDRQTQARLFYVWCVSSAALFILSPLPIPADGTDKAIFLVDQLASALLPALTLHLFLVFPTPLLKTRRTIPFLYLPSALLLSFHADQIFFGGQKLFGPAGGSQLALVDSLERYYLVLCSLLAALALIVRLARRPEWEQRRQVQWILFGLLGGYTPFLLLYLLPRTFGLGWPGWTTLLAVLPLGLVPLAFAWAILKYKLLDIGVILRDSISYSLTALVGVLGFSLANLAIRSGVAENFSLARNLLTFAAGVTIAGVLAPTKTTISAGLERLQYHGAFGRRRGLLSLGHDLLYERDLDRLCATLLDRLTEGLGVRANLYLAQGGAMVPVELGSGIPRQLAFDSFGPETWSRDVESISAIQLPSEEATAQQRLFAAGYRYAFPLIVREHRIGIALVSYKLDEEPLSSEDSDLARNLLNQASLAIENAQLLEEVHRKLQEVVRLEAHNKGILESSPAGIALLDTEDRVISANHAFAAIAGVARPEVTGRPLENLVPVRPLPCAEDGLVEMSFCELSGQERYLQLSVASYSPGEDDSLRVLVIQDISERIAMEQTLKEKERLASLGMLAAGVAHEVNTPLTGISSYAQLLLSDVDENDPSYEILKKMERQTFRAAQIVNNLLEFARNRRDELSPLHLETVIDECLSLLEERAAAAGVELVWQPTGLTAKVLGHEGELHQVFTNLVVNAIDAMAADGGRVTVEVETDERRVRARVSDTGPGIPPERLERIFHPFFSSKLTKGGTGLGLAITYNVVRRHGGEIRAENQPDGCGCTFTIELPRQDCL